MEAYRGVKFSISRASGEPPAQEDLDKICEISHRLADLGFAPGSSGNVSMRVKNGFLISATGTELGKLKPGEVSHVLGFDFKGKTARVNGAADPSSETPMHALIYSKFKKTSAIIHAHSPVFSESPEWDVPEVPYGTLELAEKSAAALKEKDFIILQGHGCVSIGRDFTRALENLLENSGRLERKPK